MYLKWNTITTTAKMIQYVMKHKITLLIKSKLMYLVLKENFAKLDIRMIDDPLRGIKWDVAIYRIDTISENDLKRVNRLLDNKWFNAIYNSVYNLDIIENENNSTD
jgi:hypothetical protein